MKKKFMDYTIEMDSWNQVAKAKDKEKKAAIEERLKWIEEQQ